MTFPSPKHNPTLSPSHLKSRVADLGGVDPDPALKKQPGPGSDLIKFTLNLNLDL